MEDKNKHNIFNKEEFFKAIDEKRSLGADADDFDKEALEGLAMVKDRQKLEKVNAAIDEIVRRESSRAGRKKNMYYFAAAASLALIIGIFFLVKENSFKEDKNLAQSAPEKTEEIVSGKDQATEDAQKAIERDVDKKLPSKENVELKGKEEAFKEGKLAESSAERDLVNGVTTAVPAESPNQVAANEKANDNGWVNGEGNAAAAGKMQDTKSGGKSVDQITVADQEKYRGLSGGSYNRPDEKKVTTKKSEESKKLEDESTAYKDADEKEKKHYETNTVWTTSPSAVGPGAAKQQQVQTESKPKVSVDDRTVTGSTTAAANTVPVQSQVAQGDLSKADKNNAEIAASGEEQQLKGEVAESRKNRNKSASKRSKSKSAAYEPAPAREENKDVAGYSYYSQKSTRDFSSPEFIGGTDALQQFIGDNLEVSVPEKSGTVTVEFTVKPDGAVDTSNIKIAQPIKGCDPCNKDVKDLVKKMPKWQPALENGKGKEYRQKMSVPYHVKASKK